MNIEFTSEEVRGDYPRTFNNPHYYYQWSETDEIIIERTHQKMVEKAQSEKIMPRERYMRAYYGKNNDLDRIPLSVAWNNNFSTRIFDGFAEVPPVIHTRDLYDHPQLGFLSIALWFTRFQSDIIALGPITFGEELLTKKFRLVEHGPPLAVEGFAKTKEDIQWFMDNMPDPAHRGVFPAYLWTVKQIVKNYPEFIATGSCCTGPLAAATFLRGAREFLMDVRKNPEMANLALKCTAILLTKRIDRMAEVLGLPMMGPDNPNGHTIVWCDGGGAYLTIDEFKRTWDYHYGITIPHCARKGIAPIIAPIAAKEHNELILKALDENVGGNIIIGDEVPTVEDGVEVFNKRDRTLDISTMNYYASSKAILDGEEAIRKEIMRYSNLFAKTPEKGLRTGFATGGLDTSTPLPHMDAFIRMSIDLLKYPLK